VGLEDLVGANEEAYIAKAAGLAADGARRASLRASLRERLLGSPLCDEAGYARRMVDALYRAWDTIGSLPPAPAPASPRSIVYA
jgi:protein O-GlcNAc transferase